MSTPIIICNFLTSANAKKVEHIQYKLKAPCYNRLFPHTRGSYANASEYVELHTLRDRRNHFNVSTFGDTCVFYDSTWVTINPVIFTWLKLLVTAHTNRTQCKLYQVASRIDTTRIKFCSGIDFSNSTFWKTSWNLHMWTFLIMIVCFTPKENQISNITNITILQQN